MARMLVLAVAVLLAAAAAEGGMPPDAAGGNGAAVRAADGGAAAPIPRGARLSERLFGLPGLLNVGRVAPGIFRGAQPRREGYATLRTMGIRTVVNLRSRHGEREAVEGRGMRYIEVPLKTYRDVDPESVAKAVGLLRDPSNHPVFVHCAQGRDRTGLVVAVYRMTVEGWSAADAEEEMQAYGFHDLWKPLRDFVRRHPAGGGP